MCRACMWFCYFSIFFFLRPTITCWADSKMDFAGRHRIQSTIMCTTTANIIRIMGITRYIGRKMYSWEAKATVHHRTITIPSCHYLDLYNTRDSEWSSVWGAGKRIFYVFSTNLYHYTTPDDDDQPTVIPYLYMRIYGG